MNNGATLPLASTPTEALARLRKNATPEGSAKTALATIEEAGYVVAPVEPTKEMCAVGPGLMGAADIYKAMIAARPKP